jgi:DNA-binding XRE family transcriptional regulator
MAIQILYTEKYRMKCKTCGYEFLYDHSDIQSIPGSFGKYPILEKIGVSCPVCSTRNDHMNQTSLDSFGKLVRDIRITRSLLLYDMAKALDISPAELSAIETGKKPVPDWFIPALEEKYGIGDTCAKTLAFLAKNRGA